VPAVGTGVPGGVKAASRIAAPVSVAQLLLVFVRVVPDPLVPIRVDWHQLLEATEYILYLALEVLEQGFEALLVSSRWLNPEPKVPTTQVLQVDSFACRGIVAIPLGGIAIENPLEREEAVVGIEGVQFDSTNLDG
jgi:hypothetical protein